MLQSKSSSHVQEGESMQSTLHQVQQQQAKSFISMELHQTLHQWAAQHSLLLHRYLHWMLMKGKNLELWLNIGYLFFPALWALCSQLLCQNKATASKHVRIQRANVISIGRHCWGREGHQTVLLQLKSSRTWWIFIWLIQQGSEKQDMLLEDSSDLSALLKQPSHPAAFLTTSNHTEHSESSRGKNC